MCFVSLLSMATGLLDLLESTQTYEAKKPSKRVTSKKSKRSDLSSDSEEEAHATGPASSRVTQPRASKGVAVSKIQSHAVPSVDDENDGIEKLTARKGRNTKK